MRGIMPASMRERGGSAARSGVAINIAWMLILALMGPGLVGCERRPDDGHAGDTPASFNGKPVLSFASSAEHHHLDPQRISWLHDIRLVDLLYTPLVRWTVPDLRIEPAAATHWEISDDQRVFTFHLRPDGQWSNGDPVKAQDFVYGWRRALLPDLAADYSQLFFPIRGAQAFFDWRAEQLKQVAAGTLDAQQAWQQAQERFAQTVGIVARDDHTLEVTLDKPMPSKLFLQLCAFVTFYPIHAASLEPTLRVHPQTGMIESRPGVESYWSDPSQHVGNGPYVLTRRRFKRDVLVLANPRYFDHDALANGGWLEVMNDNPQSQLIEFRQGRLDWLPDIPTVSPLAADLVGQHLPTIHTQPAAGTYFYNFNCLPALPDGRKNPLADARVRQALSLAIDRQTLVDQVLRLGQPVARSFVPPGVIEGYQPPVDAGPSYDLARARELLVQAGYPDGKGLVGLSIMYNTGHGHEHPAQQIKRAWEENLGVVVELEAYESTRFSPLLKNHQYTIARAAWFGDYQDPSTFLEKFVTGGGNNDCAWSHPEYDALIAQAGRQTDLPQRMALYRQAEAILLREAPIAPIFQYVNLHVYDPARVTGLTPNPWQLRRLDLVKRIGK